MNRSAFVRSLRAFIPAACVILLFPCAATAQQVSFGVKAGVALGDVPQFDQILDLGELGANLSTSMRTGFAAGGFLMVHWKSGFAIQPEVLYTQKGVVITVSEGTESGKVRVKADYVDVPILARYTFGKGVRGYFFGGPSLDFKMSAKIKMSVLGQSEEQDVSSDVETFEFALVVGGGVEFGPVLLEARWSEGLTDLDKGTTNGSASSIKSRTFLFLGGVRF